MGKLTRTGVFVGLDVCKRFIQVAVLLRSNEWEEWTNRNEPRAVARMIGRLRELAGESEVRSCYEAGPCGYGLQRELRAAGLDCIVVAPSLIPVKPGERIKTDRRDARKLALHLRAETLTAVSPPTPHEEGARDLARVRDVARKDLERSHHRLGKFLLRRSRVYGKTAWTKAHGVWLDQQRFEGELTQVSFEALRRAVTEAEQRLADLDAKIETVSRQDPFATPVGHLRCFRGIDTVTAFAVVTELYGFLRFESPEGLMAYLGLVPSEHSTGGPDKHRRGGITRAGNSHLRRVLNQSAWNQRQPVRVSRALKLRRQGQPDWVITIADKAMKRLHQRYWHLVNQGKETPVAAIAVERELVGFLWAVLYRDALDAVKSEGEQRVA